MSDGKKYYHPELDCLRFFAFLSVFIHHVLPCNAEDFRKLGAGTARLIVSVNLAGGLGVTLFFCLSSFLITSLLLREFDLKGALNVRAFWLRRILRIWPLYFAFILLAATVVPYFVPRDRLEGGFLSLFLFFGGNWACMFNGYPNSVAAPLWSVSAEEQFYLVWPILLSVVSPKRLGNMIAGCFLVATVSRVVVLHSGLSNLGIWCNPFTQLDPIALGALFAIYTRNHNWKPTAVVRGWLLAGGFVVPQVFIFLFGEACFSGAWSLIFYPAAALACLCILMGCYRAEPALNSASRVRGALIYLGRVSFGLYVFHLLAIALAIPVIGMVPAHSLGMKIAVFVARPLLAFALTLGMAILSYRFLEIPFLKLKDRFTYVESAPMWVSFKRPTLVLTPEPAVK